MVKIYILKCKEGRKSNLEKVRKSYRKCLEKVIKKEICQ